MLCMDIDTYQGRLCSVTNIMRKVIMMTFISTFSLLIIFVSCLRIKKQQNLLQRQSLSHCMNSFLTSSQQKGEFSAWLQQKEELNSQVETVCRQTGGHTNIGTNSFMYVEAANLLFCLNQKVSPTSQCVILSEPLRWEQQPGYLTSYNFQVKHCQIYSLLLTKYFIISQEQM